MSELSYKELQEQGVFDVPYRAFKYIQSQQTKIDEMQEQLRLERELGTEYFTDTHSLISERNELQARIDVYELHIKTLKNIHENDFNEESESSYILGNLDGFFECIEADLKGNKDEN